MALAADAVSTGVARYPDLEGRVVFISGGASGIGRDVVEAFVDQAAQVVFVDLDADAGSALEKSTGGRAVFIRCDVTDDASLSAAIEHAEVPQQVLRSHPGRVL